MSDHQILIALVVGFVMFFVCDAIWKFATQARLDKLERKDS